MEVGPLLDYKKTHLLYVADLGGFSRLSHLTDLATLIEGSISASHATKLRSVKTFKLWCVLELRI